MLLCLFPVFCQVCYNWQKSRRQISGLFRHDRLAPVVSGSVSGSVSHRNFSCSPEAVAKAPAIGCTVALAPWQQPVQIAGTVVPDKLGDQTRQGLAVILAHGHAKARFLKAFFPLPGKESSGKAACALLQKPLAIVLCLAGWSVRSLRLRFAFQVIAPALVPACQRGSEFRY